MAHSSYSSIDSLRLLLNDLNKFYKTDKPILDFYGTVKLHGTNSGIGYNGEKMWCQSRSNIITITHDNCGFAFFVEKNTDYFLNIFKLIIDIYKICISTKNLVIFGEWCGNGIQKGVGICKFPKMFFIFDVKVIDKKDNTKNYYINSKFPEIKSSSELNIYNIYEYQTYNIKVDLNDISTSQKVIEKLVDEVENECPVTKALGQNGIGEGIVFRHYTDNGTRFIFKAKGEIHKVTKTKQKVPIKVENQELKEFVNNTVTENRFEQSLEHIYKLNPELPTYNKEYDITHTKYIIDWIRDDIFKEERDTIVENNFEPKDLYPEIAKLVSMMFKNKIKS